MRVADKGSFDEFLERIRDLDFLQHAAENRPDSSWVVHIVTNLSAYVYKIINFPIEELPQYITNNTFIISMNKSTQGRAFKDNLCLWRCMAYHNGRIMSGITQKAKDLFRKYKESLPSSSAISSNLADGIALQDLALVEQIFKISIYLCL